MVQPHRPLRAAFVPAPGRQRGAKVARGDLARELAEAICVIHFACHGVAEPFAPLRTSVALPDGGLLSVADIIEHQIGPTELVILSACETDVPGFQLVDELIGLPAGFIQAGARFVIASHWSVDDAATMVLRAKFSEFWRGHGLAVAEALRAAQSWMRTLSREERGRLYPDFDFSHSGETGGLPYDSPYWWAGFTLTIA